jgi:hypothetical protein
VAAVLHLQFMRIGGNTQGGEKADIWQ